MGQRELRDEWKEQEDVFYGLVEDGALLWELDEEDPLYSKATADTDDATYGVPV